MGLELLTISDAASKIGDNRAAHSVNEDLFKVAVELGPQYADAIFDIKNVPEEFNSWREYLLTELMESLNYKYYSDNELVELHKLANSWINIDIEQSKKYGRNLSGFLSAFNKKLIHSVKSSALQRKLKSCSFLEEKDGELPIEEHKEDEKYSDSEKSIINFYEQQGFSEQLLKLFCDYIKEDNLGAYRFFIKFGVNLKATERETFVKKIILPFILRENKYGLYGSGLDLLITEFSDNLCMDDYWALLQNSIKRLAAYNPEKYFGVNEDINKIIINFAERYGTLKYECVTKDKLNIHRLWLTACGNISFNPYIAKVDSSIKTFADFNKKYL